MNGLWKKYPKGLVANINKGSVPEACRGLAGYLAKYVASPPVAVRRIVNYDGKSVGYWYKDHRTKSKNLRKYMCIRLLVGWFSTLCRKVFKEKNIMAENLK